jgi:hypothetical protein
MCDGCRSLNDMPANKCYKCRAPRPASPTLLDDQYGQVSDKPRVGVSVELSRVAELAARDPRETQKSAGVFEAFTAQDDQPIESARTSDPAFTTRAAASMGTAGNKPAPPPIREPVRRGISELGGQDWRGVVPSAPASESVAPADVSAPQPSPAGVSGPQPSPPGSPPPPPPLPAAGAPYRVPPAGPPPGVPPMPYRPAPGGSVMQRPPGGPMSPAPGMAPLPPAPGSPTLPPRPGAWPPGPPVATPRPGGSRPPGGPPPPASAPGPTMPREMEGDGSSG